MKKLFLTLTLISITIIAFAQTIDFGLKAGLNLSTQYASTPSAGNNRYVTGFNAGAIADIGFRTFSIQPGLFYSTMGEKVSEFVPTTSGQTPTMASFTI